MNAKEPLNQELLQNITGGEWGEYEVMLGNNGTDVLLSYAHKYKEANYSKEQAITLLKSMFSGVYTEQYIISVVDSNWGSSDT
jgi:hypothetical protein